MQYVRDIETTGSALVGWGARVLVLSGAPATRIGHALSRLGAIFDVEAEMFDAVALILDDPRGFDLFLIDADSLGGLTQAQRAAQLVRANGVTLPIIVTSSACQTQDFPDDRLDPVVLRAPVSSVALRVGFEFALRDMALARMMQAGA